MTIHQRLKHPEVVDGCYGCKLTTINLDASVIAKERNGLGPAFGDGGAREYAKQVYGAARASGRPDPEPMTKAAARFAPKRGVLR